MPLFEWFSISTDGLPKRAQDELCGQRFSVPVIGKNRDTGIVLHKILVYDFCDKKWRCVLDPDGKMSTITDYCYLPE